MTKLVTPNLRHVIGSGKSVSIDLTNVDRNREQFGKLKLEWHHCNCRPCRLGASAASFPSAASVALSLINWHCLL